MAVQTKKTFISNASNEIVEMNFEDLKTITEKAFVIAGLDDEFTESLCDRVKTVYEIKDIKIYKVILDENDQLNQVLTINKFPSLLVYENNKIQDVFEYYNETDIKDLDKVKRVTVFGEYSMKVKDFIKKNI